jgi:hypothetical protein
MPPHMSFSATTEAVRRHEKTVTRRLGWARLKPGGLFVPVEKAMGLKKGEKHVELWPLCDCVRNTPQSLDLLINPAFAEYAALEMIREGFPDLTPAEFVAMFVKITRCNPWVVLNRIEFGYV